MDRNNTTQSAIPTLFPPELTGLARKRLDAVFETQSKLVDTLPALSREWMSFAVAEQDLTADLLSKLTAARSISESSAVYQEWLNRRMEMFAEKGRKLLADTQKLMEVSAQLFAVDVAGRNPDSAGPPTSRDGH
jgi:Phasin protein